MPRGAPSLAVPCVVTCLLAASCGRAPPPRGPVDTVREFGSALDARALESAYAQLGPAARQKISLQDFRRQIAAHDAEARRLAKSLGKIVAARVHAEVELADGERVRLELVGEKWLITSPLSEFYPQDTPRDALRSFVRAVRNDRPDVLLELMPKLARENLTPSQLRENLAPQREELERLVALLEIALLSPIEVVGDRAAMPYGESYTARFVLEDGRWKVEDPE